MTDDDRCGHEKNDGQPCVYSPKYPDGKCGIHSEHNDPIPNGGRPSKFEGHREDVLEAAREPIKTRDVARSVGIGKSTLYDWLNEYDDFSDAFKRARAEAARDLVQQGLADPEIDTSMVRFLLERTFDYVKTEKRELDVDADHSVDTAEGVTAQFVTYETDDDE